MTRRNFLKITTRAAIAGAIGVPVYSLAETEMVQVNRVSLRIPNLPANFAGTTIAFLSDFHFSPFVRRDYLVRVVGIANALRPDFMILGGDYVTAGTKYSMLHGERYIEPCFEILKDLAASGGKFAVTGNHDAWAGLDRTHAAMATAGFFNLTNNGVWLERHGSRLRLGGTGDLETQRHDLGAALGDTQAGDAMILVTHNPDYLEHLTDPRVGFALCGHTHGGQIVLPLLGAPIVPSLFGQKYRYGLVRAPQTDVYITSGIGVLPIPFRFRCPPEIALFTLC